MRFVAYTGDPSDPMRQRAYLVDAQSEDGVRDIFPHAVFIQAYVADEVDADDANTFQRKLLESRLKNGVNVWDLVTGVESDGDLHPRP